MWHSKIYMMCPSFLASEVQSNPYPNFSFPSYLLYIIIHPNHLSLYLPTHSPIHSSGHNSHTNSLTLTHRNIHRLTHTHIHTSTLTCTKFEMDSPNFRNRTDEEGWMCDNWDLKVTIQFQVWHRIKSTGSSPHWKNMHRIDWENK